MSKRRAMDQDLVDLPEGMLREIADGREVRDSCARVVLERPEPKNDPPAEDRRSAVSVHSNEAEP
ncbi:MAG: hypothetical protein IT384_24465 [Deltaproteobacteria bacterium]|nr:hypothetical protein [Deltaproteobacteria bacterium]